MKNNLKLSIVSVESILLMNNFNFKSVQKYIKKHDHIMCQKFLPNISKGDKRVLLLMEKSVNSKFKKRIFFKQYE